MTVIDHAIDKKPSPMSAAKAFVPPIWYNSTCFVLHYACDERAAMKYTDLVERGAKQTEIQTFLAEGETVPVTIRIPKNLRDSAKEAAALRGVSYSAFVRMCMIQELSRKA